MFDGHVCSLLLISPLMLVRSGLPGVYNTTSGTAPEMLWCTSANGFGSVMLNERCIRDHRECIIQQMALLPAYPSPPALL